jgi:hypothetical protein
VGEMPQDPTTRLERGARTLRWVSLVLFLLATVGALVGVVLAVVYVYTGAAS